MRNKIAKEIRKYLREQYPGVEEKEPEVFKRMCKALKREYTSTPVGPDGKIMKKQEPKK